MKKQTIKLNESQLRNIIKKSINEAVCEDEYDLPWQDREPKNDMDKIRYSRYRGLVEIIEFYSAQDNDGKSLSKEQCEQLKNACDTIECFGELGQGWAEIGRDILSKNEHASINESKLQRIIRESIKKVLKENFQKPENWKDTPFQGTYQDEDGSIYMPDDDYEVIDEDYAEYGHDLNDIMLSIENDRGIYDKMMMLVKSLARKEARGVILDFNTLVKSSVINQLTNDSIKMVNNDRINRGDEPYGITPSDKQQIKIFLSNKVLELVEENK